MTCSIPRKPQNALIMMKKAVQEITKAIFPVFRRSVQGSQIQLASIGTGFFINHNGFFVTTAHLFDGASQGFEYMYYGLLPDSIQQPPLVIEEICRDDTNDILVGRVALASSDFLKFAHENADVGLTVCIAGYPLPHIAVNAQGGFELGGVRRYFQPSFVLDHAQANLPCVQGLMRSHNGFLIRDFGLYGMSGGPVVNINGRIIGMQASVTDPRQSTNGYRTITVQNAVAIGNSGIIRLLKQYNIEFTVEQEELQS